MSKIFFSYRHSDSIDATGRIFDHLTPIFGKAYLFKDADSISIGSDFRSVITDSIKACDVIVVVIGKGWLTAINEETGTRRLDNPDDFVRLEIEVALNNKIPIIPVLIGGAHMPSPEKLPVSIRPLAGIHALQVRPDPDFKSDIERLVHALRGYVKVSRLFARSPQFRYVKIISVTVLSIGALVSTPIIVKYFQSSGGRSDEKPVESPSPGVRKKPLRYDLVPIPDKGVGFTARANDANQHYYGQPDVISAIQDLGVAWAQKHPKRPFAVGDISLPEGGDTPMHATHENGREFDLRLFRTDGKVGGITTSSKEYARDLTRELVILINKKYPRSRILFSDPELVAEGLCISASGFDNHIHVELF